MERTENTTQLASVITVTREQRDLAQWVDKMRAAVKWNMILPFCSS
jgi:hypothetical protein